MSYLLVAGVMDHAPPMTALERLVLLAIAERARGPAARECEMDTATLARRCGGVDPSNVRAALRRLAKRDLDIRVALGTDRVGKPVYAWRGYTPRYRLPSFPPPDGCRCDMCIKQDKQAVDNSPVDNPEGEREHPPSDVSPAHEGERTHPPTAEGGCTTTEGGCTTTEGGCSATDPVAQHPPLPSETGPIISQPIADYLRTHTDATDDETTQLLHMIKTRYLPRSLTAYIRAMSTADLTDHLTELRTQPAKPSTLQPPCGRCSPNRLRETPDGRAYRCPDCHPRAQQAAS